MRHVFLATLVFMLAAIVVGCKKDENNPAAGDQFADKLSLGTGMSTGTGFPLVGESTTFTRSGSPAAALIYWRLECKDDYGTGGGRLQVDRETSPGTYTPYVTSSPPTPQNYGHIFVSGPIQIAAAGNYRATGTHVTSGRTVATVLFVVN